MDKTVWWEYDKEIYSLHFKHYGEDTIVAQMRFVDGEYVYVSELLNVEYDTVEGAESIDEAKEEVEGMVERHFDDKEKYWADLLVNFQHGRLKNGEV